MKDLVESTQLQQTTVTENRTTEHTSAKTNGGCRAGPEVESSAAAGMDVRAVKQVQRSGTPLGYKKEILALTKARRFPQYFTFFHGWYESGGRIFLAMEFFALGDLSGHLERKIPEPEAKEITRQLLGGLRELHRMGFAHRDLKPQNVFVLAKPSPWEVRIGDFGVSKRVQEGDTAMRTMTGTRAYMAPEMFPWLVDDEENLVYTKEVDIWALGVLIFQLLTLRMPFDERSPVSKFLKGQSGFPEGLLREESVTPAGTEFVKALLQPAPKDRLSSENAFHHPWLRETGTRTTDNGRDVASRIAESSATEVVEPEMSLKKDAKLEGRRRWLHAMVFFARRAARSLRIR